MSLRFPWPALALLLGCSDQEPVPAPPSDPAPAAQVEIPAPQPASPWPRRSAAQAHVPVLDAITAGAKLPTVPKSYVTHAQQQALVGAKNLTQRLGLRPGDLKLGRNLAQIYASNLFPDRALAVIGLCLQAEPPDPLSIKMAGAFLQDAGRYEEAAAVFEHLSELTPNEASLAGPLFGIYWELGDFERAEVALNRGLELAPFAPPLQLALGRLLFASDRPEEALPHLENATSNLPSSVEAWFRLAACQRELGHDAAAAKSEAIHHRLDQMDEFGIDPNLPAKARHLQLIKALEESGDQASADLERAALQAKD